MSLCAMVFLILLAAKVFGFAHYGWGVVFLPLLIELVIDAVVLLLFSGLIFRDEARRTRRAVRSSSDRLRRR